LSANDVMPAALVSVIVPPAGSIAATVVEPVRGEEPSEFAEAITVMPFLKLRTSFAFVSVMTFVEADERRPRRPLPSAEQVEGERVAHLHQDPSVSFVAMS
jgi:hypothetical protein